MNNKEMFIDVKTIDEIESHTKNNEVMLLKFDSKDSKYNQYFSSLELKVINITDKDIIEFYDINVLPTILVYKNKNLLDEIEGFHTKSELIKKVLSVISE